MSYSTTDPRDIAIINSYKNDVYSSKVCSLCRTDLIRIGEILRCPSCKIEVNPHLEDVRKKESLEGVKSILGGKMKADVNRIEVLRLIDQTKGLKASSIMETSPKLEDNPNVPASIKGYSSKMGKLVKYKDDKVSLNV